MPVRCGSKSIPFKNGKNFCGKPLVYWVVKALHDAASVDRVVVATDCNELEALVNGFGLAKVEVYRRSEENARDHSSTESVMMEYLRQSQSEGQDVMILAQATSPLTGSEDIERALKLLRSGEKDSLLSVVRTKRFFWTEDGVAVNYNPAERPRRQDFSGQLMENGAFYINTVANILRDHNRLSGSIGVYEMLEYTAVEIDEESDWLVAEQLMRKHQTYQKPAHTIKLLMMDVDGVLTDAGMYYSEKGDELKKFNTHDGKGIELLRGKGVKTAIITSENTEIVARRARKLKIDHLHQGVQNKLEVAEEICRKESVGWHEVAYIGDDINDLDVLRKVGLPACPANALETVRQVPGILHLTRSGGSGAVRELVTYILETYQYG